MVAALLIGVLVATSLLVAASLRLESIVSALLAGYVVLVAEIVVLTDGLSPIRGVTQNGLATAEAVLLVAAVAAWWLRGRPGLPVAAARETARRALRDPLVLGFLLVVGFALAYELVLAVAAPPNNWDSLTYHLTRAAFWAQHGGVYWIPNAPTDRLNEFQPVAEQEILYLFVATGRGALSALPQFVAELAIIAAIYVTARRLGHQVRGAACAALFFGTLSLVALEATTAQNDLVAASLPAAAAAFLLGRRSTETALAGVAVGLAVGVKATTALVVPVLLVLASARGRRTAALFGASAVVGFATLGIWGYVLNLAETGRVLGHGGGRVEVSASPSFPGSISTAVRVLYRVTDLPGFHDRTIWELGAMAFGAALAAVIVGWGRSRERRTVLLAAGAFALPLLAPLLALGLAGLIHLVVRVVDLPINPRGSTALDFSWGIDRRDSEDFAGYGPLGGLLLIGASLGAIVALVRRRAGGQHVALGLALPTFVVLLSLGAKYYPFLSRFLLIPVALTVPLLAVLFRRSDAGAAILVVSAITVALALDHDLVKPFDSQFGRPWQRTLGEAVQLNWQPAAAEALAEIDQDVGGAPLGAVLSPDEASYLLFGSRRQRYVAFLPARNPVRAAGAAGVPYVVIGSVPGVADAFGRAGWRLQTLGTYWTLAIGP